MATSYRSGGAGQRPSSSATRRRAYARSATTSSGFGSSVGSVSNMFADSDVVKTCTSLIQRLTTRVSRQPSTDASQPSAPAKNERESTSRGHGGATEGLAKSATAGLLFLAEKAYPYVTGAAGRLRSYQHATTDYGSRYEKSYGRSRHVEEAPSVRAELEKTYGRNRRGEDDVLKLNTEKARPKKVEEESLKGSSRYGVAYETSSALRKSEDVKSTTKVYGRRAHREWGAGPLEMLTKDDVDDRKERDKVTPYRMTYYRHKRRGESQREAGRHNRRESAQDDKNSRPTRSELGDRNLVGLSLKPNFQKDFTTKIAPPPPSKESLEREAKRKEIRALIMKYAALDEVYGASTMAPPPEPSPVKKEISKSKGMLSSGGLSKESWNTKSAANGSNNLALSTIQPTAISDKAVVSRNKRNISGVVGVKQILETASQARQETFNCLLSVLWTH